ncbi:helix-turn-helix domain-containing protein [Streptomyces sp. FT1]|uniref:helix-turn-helix domain-containing protein n=1 Tax=Streptomyces sp. FT1 TaxID=2871486 RepID=UPI00225AC12F|nr:helix-turn-helix transcriptional regulator [Streptomyces sp. FT1]MCX5459558.1 helix-turn-helix transcriptional regulator [Streptomyces sp. FT1]
MQQRKKSSKKVTSWEVLGKQLAEFRRVAGLTQGQLADMARVGEDTIASVEQGRRRLQGDLAECLDTLLDAKRALATAVSMIPNRERFPAFAQGFVDYEQEALTIQSYENHVVPGLLQTSEYSAAVFDGLYPPITRAERIERIAARMDRKAVFDREPWPPMMSFIVEEQVLHRPLGGPEVMREQLAKLREYADLDFISLQIMPTNVRTHPAVDGPIVLIETPDHDHIAYIEGQRVSFLVDDPDEVSIMQQKYGMLRSQALSVDASKAPLDELLGVR